jgi:hypothetical protein
MVLHATLNNISWSWWSTCMIVGFTTTCAKSAYHHKVVSLNSRSWQGVIDTTLCDKVCQWLATGRWFLSGIPVSSINKTDRHDITEILLKVALNTMNLIQNRHHYHHHSLIMNRKLFWVYHICDMWYDQGFIFFSKSSLVQDQWEAGIYWSWKIFYWSWISEWRK